MKLAWISVVEDHRNDPINSVTQSPKESHPLTHSDWSAFAERTTKNGVTRLKRIQNAALPQLTIRARIVFLAVPRAEPHRFKLSYDLPLNNFTVTTRVAK